MRVRWWISGNHKTYFLAYLFITRGLKKIIIYLFYTFLFMRIQLIIWARVCPRLYWISTDLSFLDFWFIHQLSFMSPRDVDLLWVITIMSEKMRSLCLMDHGVMFSLTPTLSGRYLLGCDHPSKSLEALSNPIKNFWKSSMKSQQ